ncbi:MAG: DUF6951 family protein [Eubacteriales bacterium]
MATVEISPGICGYITRVEVIRVDKRTVEVNIESECPNIRKVTGEIKTIYPLKELFCKLHETETYKKLVGGMAHPTCLVPSGVLKGIELAAGLALPKECYIRLEP